MERAASWILVVSLCIVFAEAILVTNHVGVGGGKNSIRNEALADRAATQVLADVGTNLPPLGRSLFDQLAGRADGAGWHVLSVWQVPDGHWFRPTPGAKKWGRDSDDH